MAIKRTITTTLPTTLNYREEIYYQDANGNLTLWVGHEDGSAWPSVGYKEYFAFVSQSGTNAPTAEVQSNTLGIVTYERTQAGSYLILSDGLFTENKTAPQEAVYVISDNDFNLDIRVSIVWATVNSLFFNSIIDGIFDDGLNKFALSIRVYP
jgi:hypothetical protein